MKEDISKNTKVFFKEFSEHVVTNSEKVEKKLAVIGHVISFAKGRSISALNAG